MGQRLREWLRDADEKKGKKRKAIEVTSCFAPLLGWILSQWQPGEQKLALAIDATTLGQRFTVLAVSVLYRGSNWCDRIRCFKEHSIVGIRLKQPIQFVPKGIG